MTSILALRELGGAFRNSPQTECGEREATLRKCIARAPVISTTLRVDERYYGNMRFTERPTAGRLSR